MAGPHRTSMGPSAPAGAAGEPKGRGCPRDGIVLRVGVLARGGEARQLCLVRNIGADGLAIRLFCDVAPGDAVTVELESGRPLAGRVAWARDGHAGIRFGQPVEIDEIVAPPDPWRGRPPLEPRLAVERLAMIRAGSDISFASTRDVSPGGACLVCERPLDQGTAIVLTLEGYRPLDGVVRWNRGSLCEVSFDRRIPSDDLGRWLAS